MGNGRFKPLAATAGGQRPVEGGHPIADLFRLHWKLQQLVEGGQLLEDPGRGSDATAATLQVWNPRPALLARADRVGGAPKIHILPGRAEVGTHAAEACYFFSAPAVEVALGSGELTETAGGLILGHLPLLRSRAAVLHLLLGTRQLPHLQIGPQRQLHHLVWAEFGESAAESLMGQPFQRLLHGGGIFLQNPRNPIAVGLRLSIQWQGVYRSRFRSNPHSQQRPQQRTEDHFPVPLPAASSWLHRCFRHGGL